jgi:hypothetical protein
VLGPGAGLQWDQWPASCRSRGRAPGKYAGAALAGDETPAEAQAAVDSMVGEFTRAGIKAHGALRHTVFGYAAREIVEDANP